ncbi:PTS glucose transporter subunit IIA [Paraglaciecola sp. 2405UD69-4]|uniref:PTS sugar transporter subunit IIA n=1 Tax=Paraglaciecola sp. 2405UD69-4 TaxID=3391836 RepID=UPI0039C98799
MTLFNRLITQEQVPRNAKPFNLLSPINGKVVPLDKVPEPLFTQRIFGEGVAIEPSGYQVFAPFAGKVLFFPELANQIRLKAKNGLQLQIQLGLDSHLMMGEGFKRLVKQGEQIEQGQAIAEFAIHKMKKSLDCTLCPITILNSNKVKGIQAHYYSARANEDNIMSIYI